MFISDLNEGIMSWLFGPWLKKYGFIGKIFGSVLKTFGQLSENFEKRGRDQRTSQVRFIIAASEFSGWLEDITKSKPTECFTLSGKTKKNKLIYLDLRPNYMCSNNWLDISANGQALAFFTDLKLSQEEDLPKELRIIYKKTDNSIFNNTQPLIYYGMGKIMSFINSDKKIGLLFHEYIHFLQWERSSDVYHSYDKNIPWGRRQVEHEAEIGRYFFNVFNAANRIKKETDQNKRARKILAFESICRLYHFDEESFESFYKKTLKDMRWASKTQQGLTILDIDVKKTDDHTTESLRLIYTDVRELLAKV